MSAERAGTVSRSPKVAISAPSPELVFSMAREAYSREDICESFNIPGDIEDEQDVVRLVAITLHGDPENMDCVEETLQERFWIDFPDGYPPLPLPVEIEEESGSPIASVLVEEKAMEEPEDKVEESAPNVGLDQPQTPISPEIITINTQRSKKSPPIQTKKSPSIQSKKTPSNYLPITLLSVVDEAKLKSLLQEQGQGEWTTRKKLGSLLILLDFILRSERPDGLPLSALCAHGFASPIKTRRTPNGAVVSGRKDTIKEPLPVLVKVGLLGLIPGVVGPDSKTSHRYTIPVGHLRNKKTREFFLAPGLVKKRKIAHERQEKGLSKTFPWRPQLLVDLKKFSLSENGEEMIAASGSRWECEKKYKGFLRFLSGEKKPKVKAERTGRIQSPLRNCPREIKREGGLLLDGAPIAYCDTSHSHYCVLPVIILQRLSWMEKEGADSAAIARYRAELEDYRTFFSEGDFYRKCCDDPSDDDEREKKKDQALKLLNTKTEKARFYPIYKKLRRLFPLTFKIIEQIKARDHRTLSIKLQSPEAEVINQALLELQKAGIPAIPDCDAIIVPEAHQEAACEAIGRAMHKLTGVCCNVGKVRYQPPANGQHAAA
jgi:hypothetical protein